MTVLTGSYALMVITLTGLALLSSAPSAGMFAVVALLMAMWGASSWAQTPAQQHRLIASAPQEAPLVVALNSSGIYFGIAIRTAIGSEAIRASASATLGYRCALAATALIYVLATASLQG
jgi:MFS transporter, DHA1 family, inner membrane transport protein